MPTLERIEKVDRVLSHRQADLRVVLEGVTIAHNASAVIRTCDAAGACRTQQTTVTINHGPIVVDGFLEGMGASGGGCGCS